MKVKIALISIISIVLLSACKTEKIVNSLSVVSEKPIDFSNQYEVKALERSATASTIQEATASILNFVPEGLFLQNVRIIYVNKKQVKVTGDVWGKVGQINKDLIELQKPSIETVIETNKIKIGDNVVFTGRGGNQKTGRVIAIIGNNVTVQFTNRKGQNVQVVLQKSAIAKKINY